MTGCVIGVTLMSVSVAAGQWDARPAPLLSRTAHATLSRVLAEAVPVRARHASMAILPLASHPIAHDSLCAPSQRLSHRTPHLQQPLAAHLMNLPPPTA